MSEADWWVCVRCQSLNSLSARKCYSCQTKKPKVVAHASEVLGYRVHESWDGKVRLEQLEPAYIEPPEEPPELPPLRDPIPRKVMAVAPPPPHGARITYRQTVPGPNEPRLRQPMPPPPAVVQVMPLPPGAVATAGPTGPRTAPPPAAPPPTGATLPPAAPPVSNGSAPLPTPAAPPPAINAPAWIVAADERHRMLGVGPGLPPAGAPSASDGEGLAVPGQGQSWSHWRDLLDGPVPDGERLRAALDGSDDGEAPAAPRSLGRAIRGARLERAGGEPDWPVSDRPAQPPTDDAGGPIDDPASAP